MKSFGIKSLSDNMDFLTDYLTFKKFISTEVLIMFYYLFAISIPIFLISSRDRLLKIDFIKNIYLKSSKTKIFLIMIFCLIMCEVFLRMFFEFLIAYMQIRDALVNR